MRSSFEFAIDHIFKIEGGFVDHPSDKGGPTNYGITLRTLAAHRGVLASDLTAEDVRKLTPQEAEAIYLENWWNPLKLDFLNHRVSLALFDQAINWGPEIAVKRLQMVLHSPFGKTLAIDGVMGKKTIDAANSVDESRLALKYILASQRAYLDLIKRDRSQVVFVRGWMERTWRLFDFL